MRPEASVSGAISPVLIGACVTKSGDSTLVIDLPSRPSEAGTLAAIAPVLSATAPALLSSVITYATMGLAGLRGGLGDRFGRGLGDWRFGQKRIALPIHVFDKN